MKHIAGQDHWYDPLVRAEHKVGSAIVNAEHKMEEVIDHDVENTLRDFDRVEKNVERFGRFHPRVLLWMKVVAFVGLLALLLVAQINFNQQKMLP